MKEFANKKRKSEVDKTDAMVVPTKYLCTELFYRCHWKSIGRLLLSVFFIYNATQLNGTHDHQRQGKSLVSDVQRILSVSSRCPSTRDELDHRNTLKQTGERKIPRTMKKKKSKSISEPVTR